jgi:hypothetical protein
MNEEEGKDFLGMTEIRMIDYYDDPEGTLQAITGKKYREIHRLNPSSFPAHSRKTVCRSAEEKTINVAIGRVPSLTS